MENLGHFLEMVFLPLLCALLAGWAAYGLRRWIGGRAARLARSFAAAPLPARILLAGFLCAMIVYASEKNSDSNSVPPASGPALMSAGPRRSATGAGGRVFTEEELAAGFVFQKAATNSTFDFSAPAGAVVHGPWLARGAFDDHFTLTNAFAEAFRFPFGSNETAALCVSAGGAVLPLAADEAFSPAASARYADLVPGGPVSPTTTLLAPFRAPLAAVPGANRGLLPPGLEPSRLWWSRDFDGVLRLTWQDFLLGRDTNLPVSVQLKMDPVGSFSYTYDLSRIGASALDGGLLAGAYSSGHGADVTGLLRDFAASGAAGYLTLSWYPVPEGTSPDGDEDGDGLTTAAEIFEHGTAPVFPDTDLDGLGDAAELAAGSDPLARDSDGDTIVDGSDPDPATPTSLADLDGDGLPDAYETHWFGSTNAVDGVGVCDATGFSPFVKYLAGINPTNSAAPPSAAMPGRLVSWKLFDPFAADLPQGCTNLVYERTLEINLQNRFQEFYVSSEPAAAGGWALSGMALEWTDSDGFGGSASASPVGDSYYLQIPGESVSHVTIRLRATSGSVKAMKPLYLVGFAPTVEVTGGKSYGSGANRVTVFTEGTRSGIWVRLDDSYRPARTRPSGALDLSSLLSELGGSSNGVFSFDDCGMEGFITVNGCGEFSLPNTSMQSPSNGLQGGVDGDEFGGGMVIVCCPRLSCVCSCNGEGHGWLATWTEEVIENYPLDSVCLWKVWRRGYEEETEGCSPSYVVETGFEGNQLPGGLQLRTEPGFEGGLTAIITCGNDIVWSGFIDHVGDAVRPPPIERAEFYGYDEGCGSRDCSRSPCENGSCSRYEGPKLGSVKFRIPLGTPRGSQISGFAYFTTDLPLQITPDVLQYTFRDDADVSATTNGAARRVVCADERGCDLLVEPIASGARVTVRDTASQRLEHVWEITNVDGSSSAIRLHKISRLGNDLEDRTYVYAVTADGDSWTEHDHLTGVRETLATVEYPDEGMWTETRTKYGAADDFLGETYIEKSELGEPGQTFFRITYQEERTGHGVRWSAADYWEDIHLGPRNGRLRLVTGNDRPWNYHAWDENGRETLRVEQRNGSPVPAAFPADADELPSALAGLGEALVTLYDYTPLAGDSCSDHDRCQVRTETRYVVRNGAMTFVSRDWRRYVRGLARGYGALTVERRRAASESAGFDDPANARSSETVFDEYDASIPLVMRGETAQSVDEEGVATTNSYRRVGGRIVCESHSYFGGGERDTFVVTEKDDAHGMVLRSATCLADGGAVIEEETSSYDEKNRLRSRAFLDGTSLTNSYSCCRLLWSRDREGRRTLRSAVTGHDQMYYAEEAVWLGEVATNGFRVTQHFFDGLGRETNTVVSVGATPGEAAAETYAPRSPVISRSAAAYPCGGDDYVVRTDERGRVTTTATVRHPDREERTETVCTNGVVVSATVYTSYRNGGTVTRREWGDCWAEERRESDYAADGRRVDRVVTVSSDCGTVTNSVSVYDLLGRRVSTSASGANGSVITTCISYDGSSGRKISETTTGSPVTYYEYNGNGELSATIRDGVAVGSATSYETVDGEVYRVVRSVRATGSVTNSVQTIRTRLTGLSDSLRSYVEKMSSGHVQIVEKSHDPESGLTTSVSSVDAATAEVSVSLFGLVLAETNLDECVEHVYDAMGREVGGEVLHAETGELIRSVRNEYDVSGNVVGRTVVADGETAVSTDAFDMLNNRTAATSALGCVEATGYDGLGRVTSISGDRYPVLTDYDTAGHKTASRTTRDDGAAWDETRWEFDPASGVNTAKEYADGSRITYSYTDNGRKTRTTWARGVWKQHVYNDRNLMSGTTYSDATPFVTYSYADSGKVASATIAGGMTYAYAYDAHLQNTNETVTLGGDMFTVVRTYDDSWRAGETSVLVTNVPHVSKTRLYDSENRVCGYALTNSLGRGVDVALAYDGTYLTNTMYTLPNGSAFNVRLARRPGSRDLVARRDYTFNGSPFYWYETGFDVLGRPTNAVDSASLAREWLYNRRSELAQATIGTNLFGYAYDTIGNRNWAAVNTATNDYTANALNQYVTVDSANFVYDTDGNLTNDGGFDYTYDAENRLLSAYPVSPSDGSLAVENVYDHKYRRVRKTVRRYNGVDWQTSETHTFVWDDMNIVLEKIAFVDGTTRTCEYFWGPDKSGTEQGAGGVDGLLAVSVDGVFYIPCYDHNGNIVCYFSETGSIAAQYLYDPYGNIIGQYGTIPFDFNFGFSTKYHDHETGMICYQRRFYRPDLGRWLNRDPIEEDGGEDLYAFCKNNGIVYYDKNGNAYFAVRGLGRALPPLQWSSLFVCPFVKIAVDIGSDMANVELVHEQVFFEDDQLPASRGWSADGYLDNETSQRYRRRDGGYDDCIMRIAMSMVNPDHYQLTWIGKQTKCNCQDYADALRRKYHEIKNDPKVKCKCK